VLLNGSTEGIVSAAAFARVGHGSLVVVLLAAIPGLMKFDLIYWWAGRLWGERIVHLFAGGRERQRRRSQKFVARVNRWGRWFTWPAIIIAPFLPIPSAIVYAIAGWTGMSWVTFLILDAIGSLSWGRDARGPRLRARAARGVCGPDSLQIMDFGYQSRS